MNDDEAVVFDVPPRSFLVQMGEVRGGRGGRRGAVVEAPRGHALAPLAVRVEELLDEPLGAAGRGSGLHG